jgi:hypothetical protein
MNIKSQAIPDHLKDDESVIFYTEYEPHKVKCSDEEKKIYGVDFKLDINQQKGLIVIVRKLIFRDSKQFFYETTFQRSYMEPITSLFVSEEEAIKYVQTETKKEIEKENRYAFKQSCSQDFCERTY